MSHLRVILVICLILGCTPSSNVQTFVGPGPDPACGGTELAVTEEGGHVSLIQQTIFASTRSIIEQYRPLPHNDWQITIILYSSRWQKDEPLTKDRIIQSAVFLASDTQKAGQIKEAFGYGDINWLEEPTRLLDYFQAHHADFKKETRQPLKGLQIEDPGGMR